MADKEATAHALADAKQTLETQLRDAIATYEQQHKGSLNLTVEFGESSQADDAQGNAATQQLRGNIRSLVDTFHQHPIVRETGVYVYKVTAFDSDADGQAALDVKYEYEMG